MTPRTQIKPASHLKPLTVYNLWRLETSGHIKYDPAYQTELRWSKFQKQLFIDSLIRGIDIPKLYVDVHHDGDRDILYVVDGQQRITTIFILLIAFRSNLKRERYNSTGNMGYKSRRCSSNY